MDQAIAPPLEAFTPEFIRQPLIFVWTRVCNRAVIAAQIAYDGDPLEGARFIVQQSRQAMIIIIAKAFVYLNRNSVLFRSLLAYVVIRPLAFFSNVYNDLIWSGFPLVSLLPSIPNDELVIAVFLEELTEGGLTFPETYVFPPL